MYPVEPSLRLVGDLIEYAAKHYPRSNPVSVCGYHIREAGCTTAQEMAYGLAIAAAYVDMMVRRGMDVDEFAPRVSFNFTCWGKIFEEVAKFRAGRRLYARMLRERFGAKSPKSWMFRTLIGGGGSAFVTTEMDEDQVRAGVELVGGRKDRLHVVALAKGAKKSTAIPDPSKGLRLVVDSFSTVAMQAGWEDAMAQLAKLRAKVRSTGDVMLITASTGLHSEMERTLLKQWADGVLELTLPKKAAVQARRVPVQ